MSASSSAAPSASASLTPGQSPPLFSVTDTDKGGVIAIVTAFCLALAIVATLVRAYVRFKITGQRLAWDDGVIGAAVLFYIVQAVLVFEEVDKGFGKTIDDVAAGHIPEIQKFLYADGFFYILAVWISKISTTLLYLRLSRKRNHRSMNFGIIGAIALTCFLSIMITALRCDLARPWMYFTTNGTTCTDPINRWQVVAAFDIFTEALLAAASVFLVFDLQMDLSKKLAVIFAFDLRLLVIVPIALRLHYFSGAYDTPNPTLRATALTVCTQVQIACAIVIASVPTLRPFMMATATHYGAPAEGPRTANHTTSGGSFNLKNIASKLRGKGTMTSNKDFENSKISTQDDYYTRQGPRLPGTDDYQSNANITSGTHQDGITRASDDSKEMIIRKDGIRKDVRYVVEYGDQR